MGKWILVLFTGLILFPVAILVLLLSAKLKIRAVYAPEKSRFEIRLLFFTFPVYPTGKKKKQKVKKQKKKKKKKKKAERSEGKSREKLDIPALLRFLGRVFRGLPYGKAEVEIRDFQLLAAGKDAASTALLYSEAVQGTAALFELFDKSRKFVILRRDSVRVEPDFLGEKSFFSIDLVIRIRVGALVWSLVRSVFTQLRSGEGFSFKKPSDTAAGS